MQPQYKLWPVAVHNLGQLKADRLLGTSQFLQSQLPAMPVQQLSLLRRRRWRGSALRLQAIVAVCSVFVAE